MVFIVVFLNEGPLEKQHLLKGYPSQIYQIKYIKSIKMRDNGIKLKPKKCELFRNQVKIFGKHSFT